MPLLDPALHRPLDAPQVCDFDLLSADFKYRLANHEVRLLADKQSDLEDLFWPWANAHYARAIRTRLTTMQGEALVPVANRYYPGYQETIYGNEGLIISKRLVVPLHSADDRALFWSYECQAEGDSVFRLEVEIDWGEPLTQRMVDGLLVAQRNPRAKQGIYSQRNAESTRVFGNPHGRPDGVELDDATGTARLIYHVLVNGIVDVSLLLTLSDVGEQVAWNAFLALRDTDQVFDRSNREWERLLQTARLWTPNPRINQMTQMGKREAIQCLVHLRSGWAPVDRDLMNMHPLVLAMDAIDPAQSRNLLAQLRRLALHSRGRIPTRIPLRSKDSLPRPGTALEMTNSVYLEALARHQMHHPEADFAADHNAAKELCLRALQAINKEPALLQAPSVMPWRTPPDAPWHFSSAWAGVHYAGETVWTNCGISVANGEIVVAPTWPSTLPQIKHSGAVDAEGWAWWALLDLPILHTSSPPSTKRLSLVWDGKTLHTTMPVRSTLPVTVHESIRALHTDELDFDLTFEFVDTNDGQRVKAQFHPRQWL